MNGLDSFRKWTGYVASLLAFLLSGFVFSFNVYASSMQQRFQLSQTQVEILGACSVGGLSSLALGNLVYNKYGHRTCYVTSWFLVTSSGLLMCLSTLYQDFFRQWFFLMCVFQFMNAAGMVTLQGCCTVVGVLRFPPRHTATIVGVYYAMSAFGDIYFQLEFKIFGDRPEKLGLFLFTVPALASVVIPLCACLHVPPVTDECETPDVGSVTAGSGAGNHETDTVWTAKQILVSPLIHLIAWPSLILLASLYSVLNNITTLARAVRLDHPESTVYIMSVCLVISRVTFGFAFDQFHSRLSGFVLLLMSYAIFGLSMLIGLFWLNATTMYLLCVLCPLGGGCFISLMLSVLASICGVRHCLFIMSVFNLAAGLCTLLIHVFVGWTYQISQIASSDKTELCPECFRWTFALFLAFSVIASISKIVKIAFEFRRNSCC